MKEDNHEHIKVRVSVIEWLDFGTSFLMRVGELASTTQEQWIAQRALAEVHDWLVAMTKKQAKTND